MRLRSLVLRGLGIVLVVWLATCAGLLIFRHGLIYPFRDWTDARQVSGLPGAIAGSFAAVDGTEVLFWHVQATGKHRTILYFMGNAGSLPSNAPRLREFVLQGYGVVALNYRGAGGAPGKPRQNAIVSDALALYDRVIPSDRPPILYGTSLGAAVAVQVAARRPAMALVLETPFARLCETAQHRFPVIPACLILSDEKWDSLSAIKVVEAPVLIVHGDDDRVIPLSQAKRLFGAVVARRKMIVYPGGRHNDLRLHGAGSDIIEFLRTAVTE